MNGLHFSENIVRLRREKGITQEELARFIGVTKASISKWETGQSLPDILLLPALASYFDVTVDALLGYEPYLGREQIQAYYHELAEEFASEPFEAVMEKSQGLVKKYYACYPFLVQMAVLWVNHFMLAKGEEKQKEILGLIGELCDHILKGSQDLGVSAMALNLKALSDLQLGKAEQVVEALEDVQHTDQLVNHESLLIQAYLMQGQSEKADQVTQVSIYQNILKILESMTTLAFIHSKERAYCEELFRRGDRLVEIFDVERLNPNAAACFHYQTAVILIGYGEEEQALWRLERFAQLAKQLIKEEEILHGDPFFTRMDEWFETLTLGTQKVRSGRLIRESAREALRCPVFDALKDQKRLEKIKHILD